jgi:hypothetical protein
MTEAEKTAANFARGRRLLRELLPWARAEARRDPPKFEAGSALGKATSPYVTLANLDALLVTEAPLGGWHADVVFKHVPPGVPNTMGTPVERPLRTRREAEEAGKRLLVGMCAMAARNEAAKTPPPGPVFLLHRYAIPLLPKLFELALAAMPEGAGGPGGGYSSKEHATERIEETLDGLCPEGFDGAAFNAWDQAKKVELVTVLHIAALTGVFAYPSRRDATPSGHQATSNAQH